MSAGNVLHADPSQSLEAAAAIADIVEARLPRLRALTRTPVQPEGSCDVATNVTVERFTILAVGSDGDDCYPFLDTMLSIDLAGDDRYENLAGYAGYRTLNFPVSLALDVSGDDVYTKAQAYGRSGAGMLIDIAGNDSYSTDPYYGYAQGSSLGEMGLGYLADVAGHDSYTCFRWCQGFGYGTQYPGAVAPNGVGVLWDRSGRDSYVVSEGSAQGVGWSAGVGVLLDASGSDSYTAPGILEEGLSAEPTAGVQGAGRALGVGIFLDDGTSPDTYVLTHGSGGQGITLGAVGGVGLFFDFGGVEAYQGYAPGSNGTMWGQGISTTSGGYGRGVDCERADAPETCTSLLSATHASDGRGSSVPGRALTQVPIVER